MSATAEKWWDPLGVGTQEPSNAAHSSFHRAIPIGEWTSTETTGFSPWTDRSYQRSQFSNRPIQSLTIEPMLSAPVGSNDHWIMEYVAEHDLEMTLFVAEKILRETVGPDSRLERRVSVDPETGRRELVAVAEYAFTGDVKHLYPLHDEFLKRVLSEIPQEKRVQFALTWNC